jgi:hypothetical protein
VRLEDDVLPVPGSPTSPQRQQLEGAPTTPDLAHGPLPSTRKNWTNLLLDWSSLHPAGTPAPQFPTRPSLPQHVTSGRRSGAQTLQQPTGCSPGQSLFVVAASAVFSLLPNLQWHGVATQNARPVTASDRILSLARGAVPYYAAGDRFTAFTMTVSQRSSSVMPLNHSEPTRQKTTAVATLTAAVTPPMAPDRLNYLPAGRSRG